MDGLTLLKILVADRETGIAARLEQILEETAEILQFSEPAALLERACEEPTALLLLNTSFDETPALARELGALPGLLVSGLADAADAPGRLAALAAGAFDVICKPLEPERVRTLASHAAEVLHLRARVAELELAAAAGTGDPPAADLPPTPPSAASSSPSGATRPQLAEAGVTPLTELERRAILDTLARTRGHVAQAAKILGCGQATLYRKLKSFGITAAMRGGPKRGRRPKYARNPGLESS